MLKRLLTLLAIFTGLAALGTPAQARFAAIDEVSVQAAKEGVVSCTVQLPAERAGSLDRLGSGKSEKPKCKPAVITIVIPTVQLQADRARE